ncbi:MAG: hypothetical protein QW416_02220 [Candidatus Nitrosocaldaceae archaeon]
MPKIFTVVLLSILLLPLTKAFAIDLNVTIFAQEDKGIGHLEAQHVANIAYNEGPIKSLLENKEKVIKFEANMDTPGVKEIMDKMNSNLIQQLNSPAQFESINISYEGKIAGDDRSARIDAKVSVEFIIKDIVVSGDTMGDGALTDLNWRGISLNEPLIVNTAEYGEIDINSLKGLIEKLEPELAQMLQNAGVDDALSHSLLDGSDFKKLPLSNWATSFEASGASADAKRLGLTGNIPAVLTTYAKGESSFREGILKEIHIEKDIKVDNSEAKLKVTIPPAYSTIKIAGYASLESRDSNEYVLVTDYATGKQIYQSQNLPIMVFAGFAGIAAVIAGIVIWKVNKKK